MKRRLLAEGAELVRERTFEQNLRYDTPNDRLRSQRQLLRLRQDDAVHLTFKGPSQFEDGVVAREEIEVEIADFETGRRLLEALGFQVVVVYEKYRTVYHLDELEISIDELPYGDFVEIEGLESEKIQDCAGKLGLEWAAAIERNYLGLFQDLKKALNLSFRDLTFDNFLGVSISTEQLGIRPADGT